MSSEMNPNPTATNNQQVTVDVPEDRVAEFHAFFARFLAGRGRRRRHGGPYGGRGGPRGGRHGRRCGHGRQATTESDQTTEPGPSTEPGQPTEIADL
jgi:hypothetical protein